MFFLCFTQIQGVPWNMTVGNSFECRLSGTVLDIKDLSQFISPKKMFYYY